MTGESTEVTLDAVAAIRLTDLLIDVVVAADPAALADLVEFGDPLTAMLAAWALGVREDSP